MPRPTPIPPADYELLLGRLIVQHPRGDNPYLVIEGWCPCCGQRHQHGWPAEYKLDEIAHRAAHCNTPDVAGRERGYYVALDRF